VTNDVSAATGGSSLAASSGTDSAQTGSATTVTPPAAALNLAIQVRDCLLSAGISAKNVVVAMLGIADAYGLCPIVEAPLAGRVVLKIPSRSAGSVGTELQSTPVPCRIKIGLPVLRIWDGLGRAGSRAAASAS
jgi:hypothetical protein